MLEAGFVSIVGFGCCLCEEAGLVHVPHDMGTPLCSVYMIMCRCFVTDVHDVALVPAYVLPQPYAAVPYPWCVPCRSLALGGCWFTVLFSCKELHIRCMQSWSWHDVIYQYDFCHVCDRD